VFRGHWLGTEVAIKRLFYDAHSRVGIFDGAGEDGRAMAEAGVIGSTDSDDERA
jgi:hypothetical protein